MDAASVGVASPPRMLPRVARISTAGGTSPTANSRNTGPIDFGRSSSGTGAPSVGSSRQRIRQYPMNSTDSSSPGMIAAANRRTTDTWNTMAITMSITLGGMRMPRVPPAAIEPAESRVS